MDDVFACSDAEFVEKSNPETWLAIVDATFGVERDERVVVDISWIGICRGPIIALAHRALDLPRPSSNKALARHRREGIDDRVRLDVSRETKLFGIKATRRFH